VQSSRAREETTFVFTKDTVNKLAEQAKPTPEMSKLAEKIEERRLDRGEKPSLPDNHKNDFKATRAYLNEHSYKQEERATDKHSEALNELKDTLKAMSTSKANESTQDYKIVEKSLEKDAEKVAEAPTIEYKNGDFIQDPKALPQAVTQAEKDFKAALEKEVAAMDKTSERNEKEPEKDAQKEAADSLTKSHGSPEKAIERAEKLEERRTTRGEEPSLPKEPAKDLQATKQYLDKNEHKFDKAKAVVAAKEARANADKDKDTDKSKTADKANEQPKAKEKEQEYQREMKQEKSPNNDKK
jgi:hypothetical protein